MKSRPQSQPVRIEGVDVETVSSYRYLGLVLDRVRAGSTSWEDYVHSTSAGNPCGCSISLWYPTSCSMWCPGKAVWQRIPPGWTSWSDRPTLRLLWSQTLWLQWQTWEHETNCWKFWPSSAHWHQPVKLVQQQAAGPKEKRQYIISDTPRMCIYHTITAVTSFQPIVWNLLHQYPDGTFSFNL